MTKVFSKIGMGTFGSDRYDGATVSAAVAEALRAVRVCSTRSSDRTATLWKRSERLWEAAMTALHEKYNAMTEAAEAAREDGAVGIRAKISIGRIRIS